jgi:WD40 repeat protein
MKNRLAAGIPILVVIAFMSSCSGEASTSQSPDSSLGQATEVTEAANASPFGLSIDEIVNDINMTPVITTDLSPNSEFLSVGREDGIVEIWDLKNGQMKFVVDSSKGLAGQKPDDGEVVEASVRFDPLGQFLVTYTQEDDHLIIWSLVDGSFVRALTSDAFDDPSDVAISANGEVISAIFPYGPSHAIFWSSATGAKISEYLVDDDDLIFGEINAVPNGFIVSAYDFPGCSDFYGREDAQFCDDLFEYTIFDLKGVALDTFVSIAPPGRVGQLVSPDGRYILQNLPEELKSGNFKTLIAGFVAKDPIELGLSARGPAAFLEDGSLVALLPTSDTPLFYDDKTVVHIGVDGTVIDSYQVKGVGGFSGEAYGFNLWSNGKLDIFGAGDYDSPVFHSHSSECQTNHFGRGEVTSSRVVLSESFAALINWKNQLIPISTDGKCISDTDADQTYDLFRPDNNDGLIVGAIAPEVPVVVNCSGLTFDDDLPIGPCTEGYGVSMIQNALISYGYQIEPDGQYGQATADAVAQFQGVKGLVVTGTVDALTYAALGPLGVGTDLNGDGVVGPNETIGD